MKETIQTKVDQLVDYVYTKGEVSSALASQALGMTIEQVEEWARPLENSELIRIKYSPLQGMVLVSKPLSDKELNAKLNEFKAKKEELNRDKERLEAAFSKYEEELPDMKFDLDEIEKKYKEKLGGIKSDEDKTGMTRLFSNLKALHGKVETYDEEIKQLEKDKKEVADSLDDFKKDVLTIDKKAEMVAKTKALGTFYDYLAKADKDLLEAKRREDKFIAQVSALKEKVEELLPQVELTHKKMHRSGLSSILKLFKSRFKFRKRKE